MLLTSKMSLRNFFFAVLVLAAVSISWNEARPTISISETGVYYDFDGRKIDWVNYRVIVSTDCTPSHVIEKDCANCDETCDSYFNGLTCEVCVWGCGCEPGYVRNSTSNDYSQLTAACIKPEECDPQYDRRPKNLSVISTSENSNSSEQNNTTVVNDSDVTTEYTTQLSDNTENYSTTSSENIGDFSTISSDNSDIYSTTLPENTGDYSTISPDNSGIYSTTLPENTGDYSTISPDNSGIYSTTLSENTGDYSTISSANSENYSTDFPENKDFPTIAATEETTTDSL